MFLADADMDRACLRQGDILERIPFPVFALNEIRVLGEIKSGEADSPYPAIVAALREHRKDPNYFTAQLSMRLAFGAVFSHCCELEPTNGHLRPSTFRVARLVPVRKSIMNSPEKLASLRANRDPRDPSNPGFIDYFYVPAHELLENTEWMIDFEQVIPLPGNEFPAILSQKILQMDDRSRVKFKIKAAIHLGRITNEEDQAGLSDPWK